MTYRLMDGLEFMKSLPAESVDGIFTDPPWKVGLSHDKKHTRKGIALPGAHNWTTLITEMTDEAARVLKPTGSCFIWIGMTSLAETLTAVKALEYRFCFFVYFIPPRYVAYFESMLDPILYFAKPGSPWIKPRAKRIKQLWQKVSTGKSDTFHPCARPFDSVLAILNDLFFPGDYIIDPLAGSDTTGYACRLLGLNWDSCEVSEKYYKTGLARHSQGVLFEDKK